MAPVHTGIKRRHFLRVLGAAAVAIAAAPLAPRDVSEAFWAHDKDAGTSIRFVRRFEVRYIHGVFRPNLVVRVTG